MANKVILTGHVGKPPELKHTTGGTPVATFSVATDESYKNAAGEKIKKTEWHNCVCWNKSGENFVQWVGKGGKVYIEGKLQTRMWEDPVKGKQYRTEIVVTSWENLTPRSNDTYQGQEPPQSYATGGGMRNQYAPANQKPATDAYDIGNVEEVNMDHDPGPGDAPPF